MYDLDKRIEHINSLFTAEENIRVEDFQSLTVDFCKVIGANIS